MPSSKSTSSRVTILTHPNLFIEKAFAKQVALMSPQKKLELYSVSLDN
jgi:hypothetical protein